MDRQFRRSQSNHLRSGNGAQSDNNHGRVRRVRPEYLDDRNEDEWGRLPGVNRFGERNILPDYYEDEYGMRHPFYPHGPREFNWSGDPRSEASSENHHGKGPKGYRRSDQRIHEDICEELTHHDELDASGIEVEVKDGIVTLSGVVDGRKEKRLAEDLIHDLRGVEDVQNRLTVRKTLEGWVPGLGQASKDEPEDISEVIKHVEEGDKYEQK